MRRKCLEKVVDWKYEFIEQFVLPLGKEIISAIKIDSLSIFRQKYSYKSYILSAPYVTWSNLAMKISHMEIIFRHFPKNIHDLGTKKYLEFIEVDVLRLRNPPPSQYCDKIVFKTTYNLPPKGHPK